MFDYRPEQLRFKLVPVTNDNGQVSHETIQGKTVVMLGSGPASKKVLNFLLTKNGVNVQGRVIPKGAKDKIALNVQPDYILSDEKGSFSTKFKTKTAKIDDPVVEHTSYHYTQLDAAKQLGIPIISFQQAIDIES